MELKSDKACSGVVFVHSQGKKDAVSPQGWSPAEGKKLCENLQCGPYISNETALFNAVPSAKFTCGKGAQNIWDCAQLSPGEPQEHPLFVKCDGNMDFCSICIL